MEVKRLAPCMSLLGVLTLASMPMQGFGGEVRYQAIALTGQPAPGTAGGTKFDGFVWPVINNAGHVAFTASLVNNDGDTTNDTGIWSNSTGNIALVARSGTTAPGSNQPFDALFGVSLVLDAANNLTFTAGLVPNASGIWSGHAAALLVVALSGMQAPGAAGTADFGSFNPPADASAKIAFAADVSGTGTPGTNHGIWAGTANNLQLAARSGSAAPGTEAGTTFSQFGNVVANAAGQIAFTADLDVTSPAVGTDGGIWRGTPSSLALVARHSTAAPGTNGHFSSFGTVALNNAGHVLFDAQFATANASGTGLWTGTSGALAPVAAAGGQAPGMPNGTVFTTFFEHYINANNEVLLLANDSSNKPGLWTGTPGALNLVAHQGLTAPGTNGAHFASISSPEINAAGEVAFVGTIESGAQGIWATDARGAVQLIALEGTSLAVGTGDLRQISFLSFQYGGGNQDGMPSSLNDAGVLSFHAEFNDGSAGVFTAALPALLRITSIQKSAANVALKFDSVLGDTYRVEYKNSLTDSTWTNLASGIAGTGGTVTVTDSTAGTMRFYRVIQL
jgi:hypothetical protein